MTPVLCLHLISRKSSFSASIMFLLLLAGHSATKVLGIDRLRAETEDRVKGEGKYKSGVKENLHPEEDAEAGFGDTTHQDGDEWGGDPDTRSGIRSMLSRGEGGFWEARSSSRCFPIPPNMALCQNIGYDSMRMPNLLGHETPAEAAQQSASWLPLLARECHPDARIFLCSLFAPICLERFISPCRSLCESVRESCAPIMSCYGYPWPEILRCDQYPSDHLMCISSITNSTAQTGGQRVPQASCQDCVLEEASSSKDTLEAFCRSDFVAKLRLTRLKYSPVTLSQYSLGSKLVIIKHGPLLGGQIRSRIELWLERDASCVRNITRQHPRGGTFLVMGTVHGERLVVTKAHLWHKRDKNLIAATRKWKQYRCRN